MLEEDEPLLRQRAKECRDAKEVVRYYALHAVSKGDSITDTAERFLVERQTLYDWVEKWKSEKDLSDKSGRGRKDSLTEDDKETMKRLVDDDISPKKYGINMSFWDTKGLMIYLAQKGKIVSRELIRKALKEMGGHYVKAVHEYKEADIEKQKEFAKRELRRMKSISDDTAVLFEDEASVGGSFRKGYGWTFKKRLVIRAPSRHMPRLNCFGAVNPLNGDKVQLCSKPLSKKMKEKLGKKKTKSYYFIKFLEKILRIYDNKEQIVLYIDNLPMHKSETVQEFLKEHPKLKVIFMPSYSPNLNPQEPWWKHLRQKLLYNSYFYTYRSLSLSIAHFTRLTSPEETMSVCSLAPMQSLLKK